MEIILQEDVPSLGKAGNVVNVTDGYARNFLFPRGKAVLADPANLRMVEHQKRQAIAREAKLRAAAEAVAKTLGSCRLTFQREAGPEGKLFGAVTTNDVVAALKQQGQSVDRRQLKMPAPFKEVGAHTVEVRLHADVVASVPVEIVTK